MKYKFWLGLIFLSLSINSHAQLLDCTLVDGGVPGSLPKGGCIAKGLQDQIGTGQGDVMTPGSSIYLIKRDPFRSIRRGGQLFQRKFSEVEGVGPRFNPESSGPIANSDQNPALGSNVRIVGGGLADSCASCHGRPRRTAGFGGDVNTHPDSRDAPHLFGLGVVEMIGDEMTTELRAIAESAKQEAMASSRTVLKRLVAKNVNFGRIIARADGSLDTSQVEGVPSDLRVRPFSAEGGLMSIREFVVQASKVEMGIEAVDPILCAATDPDSPTAQTSPAGFVFDPATDNLPVRPVVCDPSEDFDADGVTNEFDAALVDHMEFYLLNYFEPAVGRQDILTALGKRTKRSIGCTECHTQKMTIERDRRVARVKTRHDRRRGIFNDLFATVTATFVEEDDTGGVEPPLVLPKMEATVIDNFFSDLKLHDLGPAFHERDWDGSVRTHFVTEPLWGVGTTGPYGHDGRSMTLDDVIRRHGGEAQASRDAYVRLPRLRQLTVQQFLESLILFSPDDTASNLNPGDPNNLEDIQNPDVHGGIDLSGLFKVQSEGGE